MLVTSTRESDPRTTFVELQDRLLAHYGVDATSRFVALRQPATTAHLLEAGAGEPVVVLHGGDGEAVDWAPLLRRLQEHVHVYAVDRPGFGLSDPFDYRAVDLRRHASEFVGSVLDALDVPAATLVGGSMGGFFALAAALDRPDRVKGVVLVGYPAGLTRSVPFGLRLMAGIPPLARWIMHGAGKGIASQHRQYRQMFHVDPASLPALYFQTRLAGVRLPGVQDTWALMLHRLGTLRGLRPEVYLGDDVTRLARPSLLVWGEHDMAPVEVGRAAAARMPDATFVCLDGVGHFPFLQAPDETAGLILDFLARRVGRSGHTLKRVPALPGGGDAAAPPLR